MTGFLRGTNLHRRWLHASLPPPSRPHFLQSRHSRVHAPVENANSTVPNGRVNPRTISLRRGWQFESSGGAEIGWAVFVWRRQMEQCHADVGAESFTGCVVGWRFSLCGWRWSGEKINQLSLINFLKRVNLNRHARWISIEPKFRLAVLSVTIRLRIFGRNARHYQQVDLRLALSWYKESKLEKKPKKYFSSFWFLYTQRCIE